MKLVLLTALGVGGATLLGAILGFAFKKISHKIGDIILSFAAGVMLAAAILGEVADWIGIEAVYRICAFLPAIGLLAWLSSTLVA